MYEYEVAVEGHFLTSRNVDGTYHVRWRVAKGNLAQVHDCPFSATGSTKDKKRPQTIENLAKEP